MMHLAIPENKCSFFDANGVSDLAMRSRFRPAFAEVPPSGIENIGLFWHFVDMLWLYIFPMLYLARAK